MTDPIPVDPNPTTGGDVVVTDEASVLALLPKFLKPGDPAPVRDGLIAGLTAILLTWQERSAYAAAQSDPARATGAYQDGLADDAGFPRVQDEDDEALRTRQFTVQQLVTPTAIMAAVNAILAPHTAKLAQYCEAALDRWFVFNGAAPARPKSFIYVDVGRSPYYPDRLYLDESAQNGGRVRNQAEPGAARVWGDTIGRHFLLRLPDLSYLDAEIAAVYTLGAPTTARFFVGAGTSSTNTTFIRSLPAVALVLYQSIADVVTRLQGASIRFSLIVDRKL